MDGLNAVGLIADGLKGVAQMWVLSGALFVVWFILKFFLHKGGYVHILLIGSLSTFGVQVLAYRKTQYHKNSTER